MKKSHAFFHTKNGGIFMKLTSGYMIKEIAGNFVIVPVGQNVVDYKNLLQTNETGAFILQEIKENIPYDKIVEHLMLKYEANEEERDIIKDDLNEFLYYAKKNNLIED